MPHASTAPNASVITVNSFVTQEDNPEDHFTLSQLKILPTNIPTTNQIRSSAWVMTYFLEEERKAQLDGLAL
jgi:hypothetical protein